MIIEHLDEQLPGLPGCLEQPLALVPADQLVALRRDEQERARRDPAHDVDRIRQA